ncbi:helix-turn-helix domain-containing protein [Limosilactobacillus vaginalis]|uniref:Helix-turn-helix domain-containing protein n=1 Tax=Limosilactobacillus vaginalis TaxID=1633 RepID=A0ABT4K6Q5_9LACO|nr:helix-turn-helix transcriptional regulator [Limosilactobacillus vaginalis]MCZ3746528.1 helix-turn-helix domain-containing protein [Limosilactobacillus vaginalis]MCZ3751580.1 helix-turn-helix domain-containing protein [Limosilactobacillus vaginalis]MCZ3753266.1 helix-turn-helix domain-containing protein [Limosilactobacillus vaginalis]MCZ3755048.1 helix-turn-helix domain-containing protein [Limosilactobacillus vaginalis]MCZ3756752.1 helix-turn-helix domain-containing protein [Limosilactobacil
MPNELIPVKVKHTLKDLRVRIGMSQTHAANALGITEPTLRKWENDSSVLSFKDMEKVAAFYHVPLDYIFFGSNNAFSEKIRGEH